MQEALSGVLQNRILTHMQYTMQNLIQSRDSPLSVTQFITGFSYKEATLFMIFAVKTETRFSWEFFTAPLVKGKAMQVV